MSDGSSCDYCRGVLKPDVVFYGENVPRHQVTEAQRQLEAADAMLIVGSSLMVYSGLSLCFGSRATRYPDRCGQHRPHPRRRPVGAQDRRTLRDGAFISALTPRIPSAAAQVFGWLEAAGRNLMRPSPNIYDSHKVYYGIYYI